MKKIDAEKYFENIRNAKTKIIREKIGTVTGYPFKKNATCESGLVPSMFSNWAKDEDWKQAQYDDVVFYFLYNGAGGFDVWASFRFIKETPESWLNFFENFENFREKRPKMAGRWFTTPLKDEDKAADLRNEVLPLVINYLNIIL